MAVGSNASRIQVRISRGIASNVFRRKNAVTGSPFVAEGTKEKHWNRL
jgi:hypothetical protein